MLGVFDDNFASEASLFVRGVDVGSRIARNDVYETHVMFARLVIVVGVRLIATC